MYTSQVWKKSGPDSISTETYIRTIALATLLLAGVTAGGVALSYNWEPTWVLLIGSFVLAIIGIFVFELSDDPGISSVGVIMMSVGMGLMIGPVVALYDADIVLYALLTTCAIMGIMSLAGIIYPQFFDGLGPFLLGGLIFILLAGVGQIVLLQNGVEFEWLDLLLLWGGMLIFTLYVAYDWARAMELPRTYNNAIDVAGALILDAINLFIRLLEIYARAKGNSRSRR